MQPSDIPGNPTILTFPAACIVLQISVSHAVTVCQVRSAQKSRGPLGLELRKLILPRIKDALSMCYNSANTGIPESVTTPVASCGLDFALHAIHLALAWD